MLCYIPWKSTRRLCRAITRKYQVQQKSNPLKLFAVFLATAWNFCVKFYLFTWHSYLHLSAKWLFLNNGILLWYVVQTFFSAQKLLGCHSKMSLTQSYLKTIKFRLAIKCTDGIGT